MVRSTQLFHGTFHFADVVDLQVVDLRSSVTFCLLPFAMVIPAVFESPVLRQYAGLAEHLLIQPFFFPLMLPLQCCQEACSLALLSAQGFASANRHVLTTSHEVGRGDMLI